MHSLAAKPKGWPRATRVCLAIALLALLAAPADARTRRQRKPTALKVVLQPFLLAHAAVHAVAAPVFRAATAPITIAYRSMHAAPADFETDEELDQPDPDQYSQPMRAAYVRPRPVRPPRAESVIDDLLDEPPRLEEDSRETTQFESRGPKLTTTAVARSSEMELPTRPRMRRKA